MLNVSRITEDITLGPHAQYTSFHDACKMTGLSGWTNYFLFVHKYILVIDNHIILFF